MALFSSLLHSARGRSRHARPRPQGLNLVVNQPGAGAMGGGDGGGRGGAVAVAVAAARTHADQASATRRLQSGAAGGDAAAAAAAAASPAGALLNEGRWTDNGQPLTQAEGRTVLPLLDQVEQAIVARLLPSRPAIDRAARRADGDRGAAAGVGAGEEGARTGTEEERKEDEVRVLLFCCF